MKLSFSSLASILCGLVCTGNLHASTDAAETTPVGDPAQFGIPYAGVPEPPDAVIYQVNIHAFSPAGNFAGVRARLDNIKALGTNVLYLLPIYPVGLVNTVNSPYCVRDYKEVNREFGTLDDLRQLVEAAHARKMAVLLDWVADHTAWDNPWIVNKSWYKQDASGAILSPPTTGWRDVAALNYDNADLREAMIAAMRYWIFQANVDGYRCDAADFVPYDFWKQALTNLSGIHTHKLLFLAEGRRKDSFTAGFQLEYGMSFYNNLANRVYGTHQSARSIDVLNTTEYRDSTDIDQVVRYTSNHDTDQTEGSPLEVFSGKQGSMAAFVVAAYMKGVPMIYNGQEVGCPIKLSFFDKSTPIDWSTNPEMLQEYERIIGFRTQSEALKRGALQSYTTDDVCAFTKTAGAEQVLVLVNLRNERLVYQVPAALTGVSWQNGLTGSPCKLTSELSMDPYQYIVLYKH